MTDAPTRPVLRYYGGKWRLAPWIIDHFPKHRVYVEPYGGAASVLLRKARAYAEVYNDLSGDVVSLFRVLRDPLLSGRLVVGLRATPFAREEFDAAYYETSDDVERARRLIVRSFQGFGSGGVFGQSTGFRANSNRSGSTPAHDWCNLPGEVAAAADRMRGVIIESRPAADVMAQHDGPDTLHYVDPPYVTETRAQTTGGRAKHPYLFEMTDDDHRDLLTFLNGLKGMVVLSGYPSDLYAEHLTAWRCVTKDALADGAGARTECLWLNRAAREGLGQGDMFEGVA